VHISLALSCHFGETITKSLNPAVNQIDNSDHYITQVADGKKAILMATNRSLL